MSDSVRIVFLGGLGEIGRNCCCIEVDERILLVDCGIMFPDADMPGVDLVLPDFTYLRENAERVETDDKIQPRRQRCERRHEHAPRPQSIGKRASEEPEHDRGERITKEEEPGSLEASLTRVGL